MTPSKLPILLGMTIWLILPPAGATAEESSDAAAAAIDVARLVSRQQALQAELDERLQARVDALLEREMGPRLAARTTEHLKHRILLASQQDSTPPPAMRAESDRRAMTLAQRANRTDCRMVGRTFACVLPDRRSP